MHVTNVDLASFPRATFLSRAKELNTMHVQDGQRLPHS